MVQTFGTDFQDIKVERGMYNKTIFFYDLRKPFEQFSNFYLRDLEIDGKVWPSSEHYFQAMKFTDPAKVEEIRKVKKAREAFDLAHNYSSFVRKDWAQVKDDVMRTAIRNKFSQNEDFKILLLGTGMSDLVEHTSNDHYWGDGGDGSGKNMLGKILAEIREELKQEA